MIMRYLFAKLKYNIHRICTPKDSSVVRLTLKLIIEFYRMYVKLYNFVN